MTAEPQQTELLETETPAQEVALSDIELMEIAQKNPVVIFSGNHVDQFLKTFEADIKSVEHDITTKKGRKEMDSFIFQKIVKTRTAGVKAADTLTEQMKDEIKKANERRDTFKKELLRIEDEVRKPLTEMEEKAAKIEKAQEDALARMQALGDLEPDATQDTIRAAIEKFEAESKYEFDEDFQPRATEIYSRVFPALQRRLSMKVEADNNAALLQTLLAEKEERDEADRIKKIADDAAAAATLKAEAEAAIEIVWAQAHKDNAEFNAAIAEKEKEAAEARAEQTAWDAMFSQAEYDNERFDFAIDEKRREAEQKEKDIFIAMYTEAMNENEAFDERIRAKEREELDQWNSMLSEALQENAAFNARKKAAQDIIDKAEQDAADERKRVADKAHTDKIDGEILEDINKALGEVVSMDSDHMIRRIIEAIARKEVRHTSITY